MNSDLEFGTLLVPVDMSPTSEAAFRCALRLAAGESPVVIALHVIDESLIEFAAAHEFGTRDEVVQRVRQRAERQLAALKVHAPPRIEVDTVICEGQPFLEILRKADDFAVDAILIGKVGTRGTIERVLFGSTAEKVLRGSRRPVIVLPVDN